uniref:CW-type domain-containing protein n=1 Tax=Panagrolaimus superbus TaxID=310955 RepID=A0A914Y7T3_9BILA
MLPASTITSLTANSTVQCSKYNFVRKGDVGKDSSDDDDEDDDSSSSSVEIKEIEKLKGQRDKIMKKIEDHKRHLKRIRRQASAATDMGVDATVVGRRFKLSCDTKGVATDGSGLLTLCSRCWAWRELPENYYPRYMNELICDDTDGSCLSG